MIKRVIFFVLIGGGVVFNSLRARQNPIIEKFIIKEIGRLDTKLSGASIERLKYIRYLVGQTIEAHELTDFSPEMKKSLARLNFEIKIREELSECPNLREMMGNKLSKGQEKLQKDLANDKVMSFRPNQFHPINGKLFGGDFLARDDKDFGPAVLNVDSQSGDQGISADSCQEFKINDFKGVSGAEDLIYGIKCQMSMPKPYEVREITESNIRKIRNDVRLAFEQFKAFYSECKGEKETYSKGFENFCQFLGRLNGSRYFHWGVKRGEKFREDLSEVVDKFSILNFIKKTGKVDADVIDRIVRHYLKKKDFFKKSELFKKRFLNGEGKKLTPEEKKTFTMLMDNVNRPSGHIPSIFLQHVATLPVDDLGISPMVLRHMGDAFASLDGNEREAVFRSLEKKGWDEFLKDETCEGQDNDFFRPVDYEHFDEKAQQMADEIWKR